MGNVSFTIEEENLICIYHKHGRRRVKADAGRGSR